ncbi:MAG: cell division protein FtsW [Parcubacteria group bacterium GW2011_GWA2_38_13b]|nr:MAG: cell division protein FtsW [Parcubacteria group bacterium GW2011_GWA2_38_13b]
MNSRKHHYDTILLYIVFALVVFGITILSSASVVISNENFGEPYYYLKHQLFNGLAVGLALFYAGFKIDYKFWKKISLPLIILSIVLLLMVFSDNFGFNRGIATRWLAFGGLMFQPTEIVKLFFIFYLAALFEKKKKNVKDFYKGFIPFIIILSVISALVAAQPDIGTLGVIAAISLAIYFVAGADIRHLFLICLTGSAALFVLVKAAPYRMDRFTAFINPGIDPTGISYQINQALIAIGMGGLWGLGYGYGQQKILYLPEVIGDSIFAIIAEELGFVGGTVIIALFVILAIRGFKIAKHAPDKFAELTAFGIVFWIIFQAFINIASISGIVPMTGVPLPFISYGGTSLALNLFGMGVVLNISKHTI